MPRQGPTTRPRAATRHRGRLAQWSFEPPREERPHRSGTIGTSPSIWWSAWRRLRRDRLTLSAFAFIGLIAALSAAAGLISAHLLHVDPTATDLAAANRAPSWQNWLGTDEVGRDLLARLLFGGRASLSIGLAAAFLSVILGSLLGMATAMRGGSVDDLAMWVINTLQSLPTVLLLIVVGYLFEPSPIGLVLVLAGLAWTETCRLVRGQCLSLKSTDFVLAAFALGSSMQGIMFRHLLPNVLPYVLVTTTITVGELILFEATLSFLGLGIDPSVPTWGTMLGNAERNFYLAPHLVVYPGLLITVTVLCLYLIGDGLRDALDPRLGS